MKFQSNDVVFCGRIIMFLAHFFPLSERSGMHITSCPILASLALAVKELQLSSRYCAHFSFSIFVSSALNIKGVFNTSNETKYEKDATDGEYDCLIKLAPVYITDIF